MMIEIIWKVIARPIVVMNSKNKHEGNSDANNDEELPNEGKNEEKKTNN